jgi:signal transduction histidine kinase
MNRLWVRLSLMMSGVVFLVFFIQFLSIILEPASRAGQAQALTREEAPPAEITRRLFVWMGFSVVVGIVGGVVISRVVSAPVTQLVKAAQRIGRGELEVRVPAHGSQEMVELAETFNKMAADLQHAEQLRNNLMADVSHELRTPLAVLEGNLRAVLDHVMPLDEAEIANMYGQTRHLTRLVNDLRELSLAESGQLPLEMVPCDVNAIVAETLQALEPLSAEKEILLENEVPPLPEISGDPVRIRQVLFNLLFNGLRHTPPGGKITLGGTADNQGIYLSVTDTGEGLEPEQLTSVFDRFYRGDKSRSRETGGSGLGLAIVEAIVEAHGGRVEVHSPGKGQGSTFTAYFPFQGVSSQLIKPSPKN